MRFLKAKLKALLLYLSTKFLNLKLLGENMNIELLAPAGNIEKLKVVYSKELPINTNDCAINQKNTKHKVKGSISFVPSVAGLIISGEVIKDIVHDRF